MKSLIILCVTLASVLADIPFVNYHKNVGIPLAARIKEAEATIASRSRIIGGSPAPLGAHPYLVGVVITLQGGSVSACGSSMLSNTRVITAAHCWVDSFSQAQLFTLVFGSEYLFSGGVRVDTSDVDVHSSWDGMFNFENDLAIVRFNHVGYTTVIQPISLPTGSLASNNFAGVWAQATGYGMIGDGIPLTPDQIQREVTLRVLSNTECHQWFHASLVTDNVLCTDGTGPVGVCSSDSGGPLSIVENIQRVLIGVVSFGAGLCEEGSPSGYVRITSHLPWIQQRL